MLLPAWAPEGVSPSVNVGFSPSHLRRTGVTFPLGHLAPNTSGTFIPTVGSVWNHRAASAFEIKALGWHGGVFAAPPPFLVLFLHLLHLLTYGSPWLGRWPDQALLVLRHLFHPYDNLILTVRKTRHRSVQQFAEGSRVGGGAGTAGQAGHLESAVPKCFAGMSLW